MRLGEILDRVLDERKGRLDDSGIRLTERPAADEIPVDARDDRIGEAVGHLLDTAVSALVLGRDRRLAVRTRQVNDGAVIEVEFPGADLPGTSPADLFGAYHSGEDRQALGLVRCRQLLGEAGCRAYIASGPKNAVRYRIEVPRRPGRAAPGSAPPMGTVMP
jgi:C4-dicarboxylate-specific signal transduction histidine kinase